MSEEAATQVLAAADVATTPLRLAFFSPVPPAASGIADYLLDLLPLLPAAWQIDLFVDDEVVPALEALEATRAGVGSGVGCFADVEFPQRHAERAYDLNVHQLGNAANRVPTFRMALEHPGFLVLHDAVLHPARAHHAIEGGDLGAYRSMAEACGGDAGRAIGHLVAGGLGGPELFFRFPMCEDLVRASRVTGVHGELACSWLRAIVPEARVVPLAHWRSVAPASESAIRSWRERLTVEAPGAGPVGSSPGEPAIDDVVLVGSFGYVGEQRRFDRVLAALAALDDDPRWRLVVAGWVDPELGLEEMADRLGIGSRVAWLGRVDGADFAAVMRAVDLSVNLRYPPARSSSGVLHQLLQVGVPTLISDLLHWRDYPEPAVARVPPGPDAAEHEALLAGLRRWIESSEERRRASEAARRWAEAEIVPERMAASYVAAIEASLVSSGEA